MYGDKHPVMNYHTTINSPLGGLESPQRLACSHVNADDITIPCSCIEYPAPSDICEHGCRKGTVFGGYPWSARPYRFSCRFVEGIKAIASWSLLPPVTGYSTGYYQVAVNHWGSCSSIRKSKTAKSLHQ